MDAEPSLSRGGEPFLAVGSSLAETSRVRWMNWAVWLFVVLGIAARLVRYLVAYPIWHDEAFLAVNLWDRDPIDLLRPLDYHQVAPWFFLTIEWVAVRCLGYSELSLRLFPTICGVLGVLLFARLSGKLLVGPSRLLAVAIFATSFYPIRHSAEIKPYASDLLASLVLLTLAAEAWKRPGSSRPWWLLAAVAPALLALSYPAVFTAAGVWVALVPRVLRNGGRLARIGCVTYALVVVASFLAVYFACTQHQSQEVGSTYRWGYWAASFPPLDRPWLVPFWLIEKLTGPMMAYPVGDRNGGSAATFLCVLAGGWILYRQGQSALLGLLAMPLVMGLVAAFLGRYPFGGAARIALYLAPSLCLLAGLGAAGLMARIPRERARLRVLWILVLGFLGLGCGIIARDLVRPYRTAEDVRTRDFARWFWTEDPRGVGAVCTRTDLGLSFRPELWRSGMSAVYLFHHYQYAARRRQGRPLEIDPASYSPDRPLRAVVFDGLPATEPLFRRWLQAMQQRFVLRRIETFVIHPGKPAEPWLRDAYAVLEFTPRPGLAGLAVRLDERGHRRFH